MLKYILKFPPNNFQFYINLILGATFNLFNLLFL